MGFIMVIAIIAIVITLLTIEVKLSKLVKQNEEIIKLLSKGYTTVPDRGNSHE